MLPEQALEQSLAEVRGEGAAQRAELAALRAELAVARGEAEAARRQNRLPGPVNAEGDGCEAADVADEAGVSARAARVAALLARVQAGDGGMEEVHAPSHDRSHALIARHHPPASASISSHAQEAQLCVMGPMCGVVEI
jgi:hypothetical protein